MPSPSEITNLLIDRHKGDRAALNHLISPVEKEIHRIAHSYLHREGDDRTLQTADLVNEAYRRLMGQNNVQWQNRAHFFIIAAQIIRRILINYARDHKRIKRRGRAVQISLSKIEAISAKRSFKLIALDDALNRLALIDERKSKVDRLRYFGGLSIDETAKVLNVSPVTVMRDWKLAKAWLAREIT
jgi:RNA polymerase sigma factor (TIGR02999 family)